MNGIPVIRQRNAMASQDTRVETTRLNALAWLDRAKASLLNGEFEVSANQARQAATTIDTLSAPQTRVA